MGNVKKYIESFSNYICTVSIGKENETINEIQNYFTQNPINHDGLYGRVWILIGENEKSEYFSLMVAQSENIQEEIEIDVGAMLNLEYKKQKKKAKKWNWDKEIRYNLDVIKAPQIAEINSTGNSYVYQKGHAKIKSQYLYRYLMKKHKRLLIYEIDIDKYLKIKNLDNIDENINNIYLFGKDYYVESKLAVETNSLFWNYYKSGVGKRAYLYFRNMN